MKENQIAPASFKRCVVRAISTARLALGYETGLPYPVEYGVEPAQKFAKLIGDSFADRQVIMLASVPFLADAWPWPDNITYWAEIDPNWPAPIPSMLEDTHLWIFGYVLISQKEGHIVIGCPLKSWPDMYIYVVFGIPIRRQS